MDVEDCSTLYNVWAEQTDQLLSKTDYTQIAYRLAMLKPQQWQEILQTQRARITNEDELRKFDFISRACTPDQAVQQQLFQSLLKAENRRIEPWTASLLRLLNDRTREPFNNSYLRPGLDALIDVQQTGDIFFPGYCMRLAAHYLLDTSMAINDIGIRLGYDYQSHFCTAFKRKYGVNPMEFRLRRGIIQT